MQNNFSFQFSPQENYSSFRNSRIQEFPILEFQNGIYQGDLIDYKRQGKGIYLWDNGQIYIGDWKNDMINGLGIIYLPFGGHLIGLFKNNKINGPGILTISNENIYAAIWKDGKLEGSCVKYDKYDEYWRLIKCYNGFVIQKENSNSFNNSEKDQKHIILEYLNIKNMILRQIEKNYAIKEINGIPILITESLEDNTKLNKMKIGYLDLSSKYPNFWYYGILQNGLAQGLGTLFEKNRISSRGVFQKGKLDGIGRIETINGDIYDGIFIKGDLFVGVYYNNEKKEFFFSQFEENKPKKIYCSGNGFPFEILGVYKHNIYQINLSYFYKYTASEVIYMHEIDQQLHMRFALQNTLKKTIKKTIYPRTEEKTKKHKALYTFGDDCEPENSNKANNLKRDTADYTFFILHRDNKSLENYLENLETVKNKKNNFQTPNKHTSDSFQTPIKNKTTHILRKNLSKSFYNANPTENKKKWEGIKRDNSVKKLNFAISSLGERNLSENKIDINFNLGSDEHIMRSFHNFNEEIYKNKYKHGAY